MSGAASSLRSSGVALAALMRRDLSAGRRGATVASARLVVVIVSGIIAVLALREAQSLYGRPSEAGMVGWALIWVLAGLSLLMLPVLALQALRQDRASGAMELLLLAGLSPRLLAVGRWITTFVLLESLLLDALPALAVFVFFGAPTPTELAWGVLALTGWNALIAGVAVWLSALIKRTGPCIFAALALVVAAVPLTGFLLADFDHRATILSRPPLPQALLAELALRRLDASALPDLEPLRHLGGLALSLGLAGLLALWAGERLIGEGRPQPARARRRSWRAGLSSFGAPGSLRDRPLTWLLQRGAPATRPLALAIALPFPVLAMAAVAWHDVQRGRNSLIWQDWLDPSVLMTLATIYWVLGLLLALIASALQVARLRERKEWDSLLATSRRGRAIILDLLAGPGSGAAVALGFAAIFLAGASLGLPDFVTPQGGGFFLAACAALLTTGALMLTLGLVSGLAARTQAGALGLATLLLLGALVLGGVCAAVLANSDLAIGFDFASRMSAVALTAAFVLPFQLWLLSRSRRRPGAGRLFFELLLCASLLTPPLLLGLDNAVGHAESFLMTALAAAALGLPLLVVTLHRPDFWLGRTG